MRGIRGGNDGKAVAALSSNKCIETINSEKGTLRSASNSPILLTSAAKRSMSLSQDLSGWRPVHYRKSPGIRPCRERGYRQSAVHRAGTNAQVRHRDAAGLKQGHDEGRRVPCPRAGENDVASRRTGKQEGRGLGAQTQI